MKSVWYGLLNYISPKQAPIDVLHEMIIVIFLVNDMHRNFLLVVFYITL